MSFHIRKLEKEEYTKLINFDAEYEKLTIQKSKQLKILNTDYG